MKVVTAKQVSDHALQHTKGPLDNWWYEERWSRRVVAADRLRTAHPEFRGEPITKHERMADILDRCRAAIAAGTFPMADRIRSGGSAPAIIVLRDEAGEVFVMDGQARVLSALWHGLEEIDAYVYQEKGTRSLPT